MMGPLVEPSVKLGPVHTDAQASTAVRLYAAINSRTWAEQAEASARRL